MTSQQAAILRLLLICAAWAVGQTLTYGLVPGPAGLLIPAGLAVGVFALTDDLGRPRRGGGGRVKYWRGRPIDDDEPRRWN